MIATPGGKIASNQIIRHMPIKLGSKLIKTDLILLNLEGMDVILGMNWMNTHKVLLDISSRAIEIDSPYQGVTILYLPQQECLNSCAYAIKEIKIKDIPVVCEYVDLFPETSLECPVIEISNSISNFNPVPPLFLRGRTVCLQMSWQN